jgi:hypothetical protein
MSNFKKPNASKFDNLIESAPEKSLLKSLLGGSNTGTCGNTPLGYVHYAKTTSYSKK